ncbi:MAG: alpha-amylase [Eubacteriales bacterium]|nr:alpha-amylase [Eubacteriales bacterium]
MIIKKGNALLMGCNKIDKSYNFSVAGRTDEITLNIYENLSSEPKFSVKLDRSYKTGDVFSCAISGAELDNCYYGYEAGGKTYTDPYARTISDCEDFGVRKAEAIYLSRVKLPEYDWENDEPLKLSYADSIIYKINVRGFTKSRTSGVRNKGTFAGIIEKIPYLKDLEITSLELMPAYEFDEINRFPKESDDIMSKYQNDISGDVINYWGYTNGFYFAPKAAYSSIAKTKRDYTSEMKDMVKQLHRNGIEVIMEMYFTKETPAMILDCLRFWVMEYHIDGFHLYGPLAALNVVAADAMLSETKIITVYWEGEAFACKHMANYNEGFRNTARSFLKGDENQLGSFVTLVRSNPVQSANINYITNHNGFTLTDLVSYDRKHNDENHENNRDGEDFNYSWNCGVEGKTRRKRIVELRKKQIKNALMMVLLSQGTPLILAGDEFGNTQGGNNNPYCIDSETSWINWNNTKNAKEIQTFVKNLISFRKKHKILHMDKQLYAYDQLSCGYPDISYHGDSAWVNAMENYNRHIGIMYCENYQDNKNDGNIQLIYVAYNMHWEKHTLALPKIGEEGCWSVEFCSSDKELAVAVQNNRLVTIEERCIAVLKGIVRKNKPEGKK